MQLVSTIAIVPTRDVGPLHHALLARDTPGQRDLVVHHRLLLGVLGDLVLVGGRVGGQVQRVSVKALLCEVTSHVPKFPVKRLRSFN